LLGEDLLRSSQQARRDQEYQKWKKQFDSFGKETWWKDPHYGEIILIYEQGRGPIKRPHPGFPRVPKLYPVSTYTQRARLEVEGVGEKISEPIYSVEEIAIKTLDDAYAGLIAKRAAGIVTKAVIADQVRQKNELLGAITWIGLNVADQADLRQWSFLPQTLQVARIPVKAGTYKVKVVGLDASSQASGEALSERTIEVSAKKKTFLLWRSFN
jgi:hypothetical protein